MVWVTEIRRLFVFHNIRGLLIDAVVLFSRTDVTLGLWMLSFKSLLTFCDSTYWPLVIDVYIYTLFNTPKGNILHQSINNVLIQLSSMT